MTHGFSYPAAGKCDAEVYDCPPESNLFSESEITEAFHNHSDKMVLKFIGHESYFRGKHYSDFPDCDLRFVFRIKYFKNAFLEILAKMTTIFSLALIPSPFFVTYEFELRVLDHENRLLGIYTRKGKMTEWVHVGFLFFRKENNRFSDSRKILNDVVEKIMKQMRSERIIKRPLI